MAAAGRPQLAAGSVRGRVAGREGGRVKGRPPALRHPAVRLKRRIPDTPCRNVETAVGGGVACAVRAEHAVDRPRPRAPSAVVGRRPTLYRPDDADKGHPSKRVAAARRAAVAVGGRVNPFEPPVPPSGGFRRVRVSKHNPPSWPFDQPSYAKRCDTLRHTFAGLSPSAARRPFEAEARVPRQVRGAGGGAQSLEGQGGRAVLVYGGALKA